MKEKALQERGCDYDGSRAWNTLMGKRLGWIPRRLLESRSRTLADHEERGGSDGRTRASDDGEARKATAGACFSTEVIIREEYQQVKEILQGGSDLWRNVSLQAGRLWSRVPSHSGNTSKGAYT